MTYDITFFAVVGSPLLLAALFLVITCWPDIRRALRKWKARRLHERAMREWRAGMECSDGEYGAA